SPVRRRQKVATPTAVAKISASALRFGRFVSGSTAGTTAFALRFSTRLPTSHAAQPSTALRRLTMPTVRLYRVRKHREPTPCGAGRALGERARNRAGGRDPGLDEGTSTD